MCDVFLCQTFLATKPSQGNCFQSPSCGSRWVHYFCPVLLNIFHKFRFLGETSFCNQGFMSLWAAFKCLFSPTSQILRCCSPEELSLYLKKIKISIGSVSTWDIPDVRFDWHWWENSGIVVWNVILPYTEAVSDWSWIVPEQGWVKPTNPQNNTIQFCNLLEWNTDDCVVHKNK